MKKALLLAILGLALNASAVQAATNPHDQGYTRPFPTPQYAGYGADHNYYIAVPGCAFHGGHATVPAGTAFTVFGGWGASHIGQVLDWVHGSTNTITVNGVTTDLSLYFAGLTNEWVPGGDWADIFFYPVAALSIGASDSVTYHTSVEHPMIDGETNFPGPPAPAGASSFRCTVTGV